MDADAHPIDPGIRDQILERLAAIESEHQVTVLFACESGSRGWGFASPDSDYDVRFIYAHPVEWYLNISPQRDVIELPISKVLDINGWELRKALGLLARGNATLIEWLDSPIVYRADRQFLEAIREAARQVHRPERTYHHYLHMARKNYREYLQGDRVRLKKYLYVLRPLLATLWIEQRRGLVPMPFEALVAGLLSDPELLAAIAKLLEVKRSVSESGYGRPLPAINQFIEIELKRLETVPPPVLTEIDYSILDRLMANTILQGLSRQSIG